MLSPPIEIDLPASWAERMFYEYLLDNQSPYQFLAPGGARGGSKSEMTNRGGTMISLIFPGSQGLILRRGTQAVVDNYKERIFDFTEKIKMRAAFEYNKQERRFYCATGSQIRLGYIDEEKDFKSYIGQEYDWIALDQAEQHPEQHRNDLISCLRRGSSKFIPKAWFPFNPGGIGQRWLERDFVNPETRKPRHLFIPCKVMDNPAVVLKTPGYVRDQLRAQPDWRLKQWLLGDMNAASGQYFDVKPSNIRDTRELWDELCGPGNWPYWGSWYAGVDYGDTAPFAVIFFVRWKDHSNNEHCHIVSELYQSNLDIDEQAMAVKEHEQMLKDKRLVNGSIIYFADPQVRAKMPRESGAESRFISATWEKYGFYTNRATTRNRVAGWKLMKMLLRHDVLTIDPSCKALLRELQEVVPNGWPGTIIDEDIAQSPEIPDHAIDATRYGLVSTFGIGYEHQPCDLLSGRPLPQMPEVLQEYALR